MCFWCSHCSVVTVFGTREQLVHCHSGSHCVVIMNSRWLMDRIFVVYLEHVIDTQQTFTSETVVWTCWSVTTIWRKVEWTIIVQYPLNTKPLIMQSDVHVPCMYFVCLKHLINHLIWLHKRNHVTPQIMLKVFHCIIIFEFPFRCVTHMMHVSWPPCMQILTHLKQLHV